MSLSYEAGREHAVDMMPMDIKEPHDLEREQLIERYASGRLSPEETEAFEDYLVTHPEVLADVEAAEGLKAGLAELRQRGELGQLIGGTAGRRSWLPAYALVASVVAAVALGVLGYVVITERAPTGDLYSAPAPAPLAVRLESARASGIPLANVIDIPSRPTMIELRTDVSLFDAASFSVQLDRRTGSVTTPVLILKGLTPDGSGDLAISLHSATLPAGDYVWTISGTTADGDRVDAGSIDFTVRSPR